MRAHACAFAALAALILMTACARPMVWRKAGESAGARQAVIAACEAMAARESEREFRQRQTYASDAGMERQDPYAANMAAYTQAKTRDSLFTRCMRSEGYRKAPAPQ